MRMTTASCLFGILLAGTTSFVFWLWNRPEASASATSVCSAEETERFMQRAAFFQVREHLPYATLLSVRVRRCGDHWLATGTHVPPSMAPGSWQMEFTTDGILPLSVEVDGELVYDSR